jgi:hypothetical protein
MEAHKEMTSNMGLTIYQNWTCYEQCKLSYEQFTTKMKARCSTSNNKLFDKQIIWFVTWFRVTLLLGNIFEWDMQKQVICFVAFWLWNWKKKVKFPKLDLLFFCSDFQNSGSPNWTYFIFAQISRIQGCQIGLTLFLLRSLTHTCVMSHNFFFFLGVRKTTFSCDVLKRFNISTSWYVQRMIPT